MKDPVATKKSAPIPQPADTPRKNEKESGPKIAVSPTEPLGMKFVKLPKGTFWMGWDSDNKQSKQVTIDADFELAAYTVTQAQWQEVMGNNPSYFSREGGGKQAVQAISDEDLKNFPVENVAWQDPKGNDIQEFLIKLNEGEKGRGWYYRLPSEKEWEYACRGGAASKEECSFDFYLDKPTNDLSSKQANFNGEYPAGNGAKGSILAGRRRWVHIPRTSWGCTTCTAMCGNGVRIYGMRRARTGCSGAAAGSTMASTAGRPTATGTRRPYRFINLGFRLARVPSGS